MYNKDDYVIYGKNGVCIIEDITDKKYMEMAENAVYLEIGTALGIKKSEVLPLIVKVIGRDNLSKV